MKRVLTSIMLLGFLLTACGSETGPASSPGGSSPEYAAFLSSHHIDPDLVKFTDWEWYRKSPRVLPEITGRILSPDGDPVPGATVDILIPPPREVSVPRPLRTVHAEADGTFRADGVPENAWLFARAPGYAGRVEMATTFSAGRDGPGKIALRTCTSLSGTVKDKDGNPVAGADVMASTAAPDWFERTETDADGHYRIDPAPTTAIHVKLLPGRYLGVPGRVDLSDGKPKVLDLTVFAAPPIDGVVTDQATGKPIPGAVVFALLERETLVQTDEAGKFHLDGACQQAVFVRAMGYAEMRVTLNPLRDGPQTVRVPLPRGAIATGRVVDETGKPVAGVRVRARIVLSRGPLEIRGPLTREDGTFTVGWLPAPDDGAECRIVALNPDWNTGISQPFEIRKGELHTGSEIVVEHPYSVGGRLRDEKGDPIPDATIRAHFDGQTPRGFEPYFVMAADGRTDGDGHFELHRMRPGFWTLEVRSPGWAPFRTRVEVPEGHSPPPLEIQRPVGKVLAGKVLGTSDGPFEGLSLEVRSPDGSLRESIPVADDGTFRIRGLAEGSYILHATARENAPDAATVRAGDENCRLILRGLSDLEVHVLPPPDQPLSGRLEIRGQRGEAELTNPMIRELGPDSDTHEFKDLPAGTWLVRVESGDYYAEESVLLARGKPVKMDLKLSRGGTIAGQVAMPDGQVISGVTVTWEPAAGGPLRGVDTNTQGRYRFRGVPPGDVRVKVHVERYPATEKVVTVKAGEKYVADLTLMIGGRLGVTVRDAAGKPVAGARVGLVSADGGVARFWFEHQDQTSTARDGTILLIGLTPGRYTVVVHAGDREQKKSDVAVKDGEQTDVVLDLP